MMTEKMRDHHVLPHWPHLRVLEAPCLVFIDDAGSKIGRRNSPYFLILLTENTRNFFLERVEVLYSFLLLETYSLENFLP